MTGSINTDDDAVDLLHSAAIEITGSSLTITTETIAGTNSGAVRFAAGAALDSTSGAALSIETTDGGGANDGAVALGQIGANNALGGVQVGAPVQRRRVG